MNKTSDLDCFLYWMWNVWNKDVCENLYPKWYDPIYGNYLWGVWMKAVESSGNNCHAAPAQFYANVDCNIRKRFVDVARQY